MPGAVDRAVVAVVPPAVAGVRDAEADRMVRPADEVADEVAALAARVAVAARSSVVVARVAVARSSAARVVRPLAGMAPVVTGPPVVGLTATAGRPVSGWHDGRPGSPTRASPTASPARSSIERSTSSYAR